MKPMHAVIIALATLGGLPTMESEAAAALAHVQTLPAEDQPFAAYLTTYSIDEGFLGQGETDKVVAFWVNSLSSKLVIERPVPVSPTLLWLDLRNYGWTREAWAAVTSSDPYQQPGKAGALCVRADWFVVQTSDATRSDAYYRLLYQNKVPRTLKEFQDAWKVRLDDVRAIGLETGAVVETGESIVAIHNRILARAPTITGAYWQSFDVKLPINKRDYLETLSGVAFDAQEHIVSTPNGLHAYFLSNGKGERQDSAPTDIAIDRFTDPRRVEVRTARSCVICHADSDGIHPPKNAIKELTDRLNLKVRGKALEQFVKQFYLTQDGKKILSDQRAYAEAVHNCNGLTPKRNAALYQRLLVTYEGQVSSEQAAREFGLSVEEFRERLGRQVFVSVAGNDSNAQVAKLAIGRSVARETYEGGGVYDKIHAIIGAQK